MPTARAVTASIAPRVASPSGGLRTSVSSSIKSSPIKMISIGPEGGRARVDTSFGSPFARMKPSNPVRNSGQIFGENSPLRPKTREQTFGPAMGSIKFAKPAPKVGFTPELASRVDAYTAFSKARSRNQAQVTARKTDQQISELVSQNKPSLSDQLISRPADALSQSIDFRAFQTIPQAQEPAQANQSEKEKTRPKVEVPKPISAEPFKRAIRPSIRIPLVELKPILAQFQNINRRGETVLPAISLVETFKKSSYTRSEAGSLPIRLRNVAMSAQEVSSTPRVANPAIPVPETSETKATLELVSKATQGQKDLLVALAPLLKDGHQSVKDRVYQMVGLPESTAQALLEDLVVTDQKKTASREKGFFEKAQTSLQQAATVIRFVEGLAFRKIDDNDEDQENKKSQNLVDTIKQTGQLVSLGLPDAELKQLVERQLEVLDGNNKKKLALRIITEVKMTNQQNGLLKIDRSELQRDPDATRARIKAGTKAVDQAQANDLGEVSTDSAAGLLIESYKKPILSAVAITADRTTDGSYDRIILAVKRASKWLKRPALAQVIDQAMEENPAVVEVEKRLDKAVTQEDKEKVLDRSLRQLVNSLLLPMSLEDKFKSRITPRLS